MRRKLVIAGSTLAVLVALAAGVLAFHNPLAATVIRSVAKGAGYNVGFGNLDIGLTRTIVSGTKVTNRTGEPVFDAGRIEVQYAIGNVLPGRGRRRFGISALDIQRPTITLIHHADGTYNIALPSGGGSSKPDTTPIDLRARIRDGTVVLIDRFLVPGQERRQRIVGLAVDAALVPHAHSFYNVNFDLDDGHTRHPVIGKATFAADRGFESQHWTAADVPIGPLLDFALPSHAINIVDGDLRGVDGRIYSFVDPDGTTHTHMALRADLTGGKVYVAGVLTPLRDAHGTLLAFDDGLTTTGIDASIAGVPLHLAGGLYHLSAPRLRFALTGQGQLAQLQTAIAPAQRQPLAGDLAFAVRAEGAVSAPVIAGKFSAPQIMYRNFPIDSPGGNFSIHGQDLDVLGAHLAYGPIGVEAHGTLVLAKQVRTNLVVAVNGKGDRIPYVGQVLRGLQLASVVHVSGTGSQLATAGIVYGNANDGSLDALVNVAGNGTGVIGPLAIERNDGASIYARVALDRTKSSALGILDARHFSLLPGPVPALPGIRVAALPAVAGTLDANVVGGLDNARLDALAGHVRLAGLRFGAIGADANADLASASDGSQRGRVHVGSSLGTLDGTAVYDDGLVGFDGALHSSFAQLQPVTGNLAAAGTIDGTLRALSDGATSAVQAPEIRFGGASIHSIPLRNALATATLHDGALDVRALQLGIGGGTVTARGQLGSKTGELVATTSPLDLRTLAGTAAPVTSGTVMANVHLRGALTAPQATIGVLIDRARARGLDVSANAIARYGNGTLHIDDASAIAFGSYVSAAGDVRNLTGGTPAIDLTANVRGAQLAPIGAALKLPLRYPDGELDADLHATGLATAPHVEGTIRIPRGSLNGLNFSNAGVAIAGSTAGVTARNGRVKIGTTAIAFSGSGSAATQQFAISAPHVDLADFDDYFDAADTLSGKGHLIASGGLSHTGVRANADVDIENARFRRFSVGNVAAKLATHGRTVDTNASVRSDHGTAIVAGHVTLPASDPLRNTAGRATLDETGTIAGIDLAQWLPTAGLNVPVTGIVDGSAHVTGTPAAPAFVANAAVTNGIVQGYKLSVASLAVNGDARNAHITSLAVAGPGLRADGAGSLGYGARDPIALALHVQSDDIALLAKSLGQKVDASGAFTTTLNASGTRDAPKVADTFDVTNLKSGKYTLPRLHAEVAADPRTLRLQTLEADLQKGRLIASATLPIQLSAPYIRTDPLRATLAADDIELAQFADLLPDKSKLSGRIDGRVDASGTVRDPAVNGTMALAGGDYSSALVRSAFTNMRARLDFTQREARISALHADVGGGAFDGTADATYGDLRNFQQTLAFNGQLTAQRAAVNLNGLFRGTIDGTVTASKAQGTLPAIGGALAFSKSRLQLTALLPKGGTASTAEPSPTANFGLNIALTNDVRVQGPGVDIGAKGAIDIGGNLAKPAITGQIASTDGTLSFYRTFVLHTGVVTFAPENGLIPNVDATATTTITNPNADILLHVTGPATTLNVDLASSPSYDKEQILGLLIGAQALGAVPGVETASSGSAAGINAGSIAGGVLGNELTQNILQPLGSQLGQSLGFDSLALGYDFGNGFSAGARRKLGKNLYASFNQTFGGDERQTIALNYDLPKNASAALTFFNAGNQPPSILHTSQLFAPADSTNYTLQALQPPPGQSGVILTYQRKY